MADLLPQYDVPTVPVLYSQVRLITSASFKLSPAIVKVPVDAVLMVPVVAAVAVNIPFTYKLTVEPALEVPVINLVELVNELGLVTTGAISAVLLAKAEPPLPAWQAIIGSD